MRPSHFWGSHAAYIGSGPWMTFWDSLSVLSSICWLWDQGAVQNCW